MAIPVENRRQSGLWAQNPATGVYEQTTKGPFEYYKPPSNSNPPRRSFSERTGNSAITDTYLAATQNKVPNAGSVLDKSRARDLAMATHSKIAASLHAYSGDSKSEDFARTGHASAVHTPQGGYARKQAIPLGSGASKGVEPLIIDPNAVPENLRTKPWSPPPEEPTSAGGVPLQQTRTGQSSNAAEVHRRGSVPDRSPLQQLEGHFDGMSKEQKRAKLEQAEERSRQKSIGGDGVARGHSLRHEKGRVFSEGSSRHSEPTSEKYYRQVSAGAPIARPPENFGSERFSTRDVPSGPIPTRERSVRQAPPIVNNPRPYHHAPSQPRSMAAADPLPGAAPRVAGMAQPYHHAPEQPTSVNVARYPHNTGGATMDGGSRRSVSGPAPISREGPASGGASMNRSLSGAAAPSGNNDLRRTDSGKYRHRLRDAGYAGAAAAVAGAGAVGAAAHQSASADRGKALYDDSRGTQQAPERSPVSPITPTSGSISRNGSKRLQKRNVPPSMEWKEAGRRSLDQQQPPPQQRGSMDSKGADDSHPVGDDANERSIPPASQDPDPIPRARVATGKDVSVPYQIPPQTSNAQAAREQVGFDSRSAERAQRGIEADQSRGQEKHHRFGGMFHRSGEENGQRRNVVGQPPLEEWRSAMPLRLGLADLEFDGAAAGSRGAAGDNAWWEQQQQRRSGGSAGVAAAQYDGPYEEESKSFRPPLFLKCGPLLRYTGIRKETSQSTGREREIWRGSIMVVTEDGQSDYSSVPVLRLFAQPMDLHVRPPRQLIESGQEMPPEDEDPVAGQVKVSRTGRPLYVRPVHDIEAGVDLSREENNQGLYSANRTPMLGPQFSNGPDGRQSPHITFQDKNRIKGRDGEKAGRYREVRAIRLHAEHGFTFWRWSLEIELGSSEHRVAYRINRGPALGFWVPPRGQSMNIMFHSCNGFSLSVDANKFSGPDPLWRDVLNRHQSRPFHVMIGGGDQIYNDAAMRDTTLFKEWLQTKNWESKSKTPFSPEMQEELESFYFNRYSMWFSQGLFAMAGSQIPMVNVWDDHDIIDGFGSYPHHFMSTPVFTGLGAIAFKYYMLFQHQSVPAETTKEEPSWILGASPGPYINELSRSVFVSLGRKVALLGLDCRTERMRDEILSLESYDRIFDRARADIRKGETKHLIVLLGVPIAYPRLNFLENILTSRAMDPIKAIGRTGMLGGFVNKFDGGVEILDDLDDHWTAKHHKAERNWFVQELQALAAEKSVRVTILGGDVHLGAVGQFYTPKRMNVGKDRDHRYMPNVISSAIVNTPPPPMMADVLNRRNHIHHLDDETDEDLIPMFEADVDGSKRNNKCLLPRRNYCTIREFQPGSTPPPTPPEYAEDDYERDDRDRRFPPGSMLRTMSLTRGGANKLVRRFSGSKSKNPPVSLSQNPPGEAPPMGRSASLGGPTPGSGRASMDSAGPPQRPTNMFHRRPTGLSEKEIRRAAAKGGAPEEDEDGRAAGHVNLEGGLDISLNMEVDQQDPGGSTTSYRLLVPALWYEGTPDVNTAPFKSRGVTFMDRFRGRGKKNNDDDGDYTDSEGETPPPSRGQQQQQYTAPMQPPPAASRQPPQDNSNMNSAPYNSRRPSLMDRLRGRGKQNNEDYTDSEGGTPPPSRGQRQQYAAPMQSQPPANRQPQQASYANDGGYDVAPRRSTEQTGTAYYSKGYNLSPPLSSSQQTRAPPTNNTTYPQSGAYRGVSAPTSQNHSEQVPGPYNRGQDEYSQDSLTPTDDMEDGPPGRTPGVQPRRLSKAERFFGIGDEGPKRASTYDNGGYVDGRQEKAKPKWMIWK